MNKIKLGMPILFEYNNIEDNLILAKNKLNLDFIELNLNLSYCRKEMEEGKLKSLLDKYQLLSTLHFFDEADFGSYDEVVNGYLILLDKYLKLGKDYIKYLVVHLIPGPYVTISGIKNYIYEKEFNEYIERFINNLYKVKDICDKYNVNLVLENTDIIPSFYIKTYERLLIENFSFCYDIGHDHLSNDIIYNYQLQKELPFKEFHFHDGLDNKKCHLTLGSGSIDLNRYFNLACKNNAWINIEVKQKEDIINSVKYINKLINKNISIK